MCVCVVGSFSDFNKLYIFFSKSLSIQDCKLQKDKINVLLNLSAQHLVKEAPILDGFIGALELGKGMEGRFL
jgi:hypothetical protein